MADPPDYPGAPRWVKVSGIIGGALVLFALILILGGGGRHGPGRHAPGSESPRSDVTAQGGQPP